MEKEMHVIQRALEDFSTHMMLAGRDDFNVRSYSGRGMMGDNCLGVVCHNPVSLVAELCAYVHYKYCTYEANEFFDALNLHAGSMRTDHMGLTMILYWHRGVHHTEVGGKGGTDTN